MRYLIPVLLLVLSSCYTPLPKRTGMAKQHWQMYKYYKVLESYGWGTSHGQAERFYRRRATYHYGEYRKFKDAKE